MSDLERWTRNAQDMADTMSSPMWVVSTPRGVFIAGFAPDRTAELHGTTVLAICQPALTTRQGA